MQITASEVMDLMKGLTPMEFKVLMVIIAMTYEQRGPFKVDSADLAKRVGDTNARAIKSTIGALVMDHNRLSIDQHGTVHCAFATAKLDAVLDQVTGKHEKQVTAKHEQVTGKHNSSLAQTSKPVMAKHANGVTGKQTEQTTENIESDVDYARTRPPVSPPERPSHAQARQDIGVEDAPPSHLSTPPVTAGAPAGKTDPSASLASPLDAAHSSSGRQEKWAGQAPGGIMAALNRLHAIPTDDAPPSQPFGDTPAAQPIDGTIVPPEILRAMDEPELRDHMAKLLELREQQRIEAESRLKSRLGK